MSDIAIGKGGGEETFRTRTVVLILAVGILGFIATLVLGAFAPDLRSGRNGGAHALSTSATGYSGIVRLARATGRNPQVTRDEHLLNTKSLVILTPEKGATDMSGVLAQRGKRPTLVVLPKWDTLVDPLHNGWVHYTGLKPTFEADGVLAPADKLTTVRHPSGGRPLRISTDLPQSIRLYAPRPLQTISGRGIVPLITDQDGRIVLARLPGRDLFVLADPDLLSNLGMADATQAKSALELLDSLNYADRGSILFDVTLNGFGHSRSPLKLLFEPPFLAALQGVARFGSPRPRERAIAFGKAALIDNAAMLVRKAGRQAMLGPRYVDTIRERAVTVFGVSPQLRDGAIDTYLDGLGRRERFTDLAENARAARDRRSVFAAAQALHLWLWEKNR